MIEFVHQEESQPCEDCGHPVQDGWIHQTHEIYYCPECFRCYLISNPRSKMTMLHVWPSWLKCGWTLGDSGLEPPNHCHAAEVTEILFGPYS